MRRMARVAALVAGLGLLAASGAGATAQSGLHGVVTRGPITPVCIAGQPCSAPVPGATLVFQSNGHAAVRARTNSRGAYRIVLAPGTYSVALTTPRRMGPTKAHVVSGRFSRVDFSIDTGIR